MRVGRAILVVLALAIVGGLGAVLWLLTHQPEPRVAEGWSLGTPLPARRGELATAVGYAHPCNAPSCADSERLYVLGGLAGFFEPQARVEFYDAARNEWASGVPLPAPRHHFAAARLGNDL